MFSPTSMSAMSTETISKAVCESSELCSTVCVIMFGLASTSLWSWAEPIALTIPSPTRAMIVSSVAPPTSRSSLVRTVTRALARSWMPLRQTASRNCRPLVGSGQSITFGLTLYVIAEFLNVSVNYELLVTHRTVGNAGYARLQLGF